VSPSLPTKVLNFAAGLGCLDTQLFDHERLHAVPALCRVRLGRVGLAGADDLAIACDEVEVVLTVGGLQDLEVLGGGAVGLDRVDALGGVLLRAVGLRLQHLLAVGSQQVEVVLPVGALERLELASAAGDVLFITRGRLFTGTANERGSGNEDGEGCGDAGERAEHESLQSVGCADA